MPITNTPAGALLACTCGVFDNLYIAKTCMDYITSTDIYGVGGGTTQQSVIFDQDQKPRQMKLEMLGNFVFYLHGNRRASLDF